MNAVKTFTIERTFSTLLLSLALAASCSGDKQPEEPEKVATTAKLTITHPKYFDGKLNVIAGGEQVVLDSSCVEVVVEPPQRYTLEFVADSNEYFTFTAAGVLTGLKEGAGELVVRALTKDGKELAAQLVPVSVVGMLVTLTHRDYKNDTLTVGATATVVLTPGSNLKVEPENPDYTITFVPKATRYFTFTVDEQNSRLTGVLDGTGTIEALVMRGSDTLKVQPFNVKVTPHPNWVKAVTVVGDKTAFFIKGAAMQKSLKEFFDVEGGANKTLRFTSSNTSVATVDENTGVVSVSDVPDYAFIKATAVDGSQRADSIRVTTAWVRPPISCDWNLCNILTDNNTREDPRYVSCKVWDGDVATSWVYKLNLPFTRPRYPGVMFLRGVYGKEWVEGDYNPMVPDWVLGGEPIPKKETSWGVWSANTEGTVVFKKLVITRGFYTNAQGRKIFQSGAMYLELWDNERGKLTKVGKHIFTDNPNDNEWVINLTKGQFEVWNASDVEKPNAGTMESFPNGVEFTEFQMMFSTEGADPASDGYYYWAIADVLGFED